MRVIVSVLALAAGVTAATTAQGADLTLHVPFYETAAVRTSLVTLYDYEPGTLTRAYWLAPWHGRHYFPSTGKKPKLGRRENLTQRYRRPEPAESYFRYWSSAPAEVAERPRLPSFDSEDAPPMPPK